MERADKASLESQNLMVNPGALGVLENCINMIESMKNDRNQLERLVN